MTKVSKIGKMVGFCDISMLSISGQELAKGSHIKFLPMGFLWDFIFSPFILPCTLYLLEVIPAWLKSLIAPNFKHTGPVQRNKDSIFEEIGILKNSNSFIVKPNLCNPTGHLHGGALAVACEEFIQGKPYAKGKKVNAMNLKYLRSMTGDLSITANLEQENCSGEVKNSKGVVCAQFTCKLTT